MARVSVEVPAELVEPTRETVLPLERVQEAAEEVLAIDRLLRQLPG